MAFRFDYFIIRREADVLGFEASFIEKELEERIAKRCVSALFTSLATGRTHKLNRRIYRDARRVG